LDQERRVAADLDGLLRRIQLRLEAREVCVG
jgi:hypothetical protein